MARVVKYVLAVFIFAGMAICLYSGWEIWSTYNMIKNAAGRTQGVFTGYHEVEVESRSSSTNQFDQLDFDDSTSYMSYPQFAFVGKDNRKVQVRESKQHIFPCFKPGQAVEVVILPNGDHRLAGFYSLYARDICILVFGIFFLMIPLLIVRASIHAVNTPAGKKLEKMAGEQFDRLTSAEVGPLTVSTMFKGVAIFIAVILIVALSSMLVPYLKQMRLGFDYGLIEALEQERFDEARELIIKKKGINRVDEYNQSPLILALQKRKPELARLLIEAGANVNIESKTLYRTALQTATQSGDLETVRLLLVKGALPDANDDENPPVFTAIMKDHDEIARLLVESGCDLKRQYVSKGRGYTAGDLAVIAKKPALVELIRKRGGAFTRSP